MREGYGNCFMRVCVCYHASCYIPGLYVEIKVPLSFLCRFLHIMWISLKMLCSEVLAIFADHLCLLDVRWTKLTEMASFQDD